jgi:hypothetical protein
MLAKFSTYGFLTLSANDSITITGAEGLKAVNIYNPSNSTGNCTVIGSIPTIGGRACNNVIITPGDPPFNISINVSSANDDKDIDGITITTASGCTVLISAMRENY